MRGAQTTSWAGTVSTRSEISKHSQISEQREREKDTDEPKMNWTGVTKIHANKLYFLLVNAHIGHQQTAKEREG